MAFYAASRQTTCYCANAKPMTHNAGDRKVRILLLEDDPQDRELVARALSADGLACELAFAATETEFQAALARLDLDLILCDYMVPSFNGPASLAIARKMRPNTPVVFISGSLGEERVV